MTDSQIAEFCKALSDENRVKIVKMLTGGELCACKILEALNITQPTLSHHMKILSDCGLIFTRKDGKWSFYSINCGAFKEFKTMISKISCAKNTGLGGETEKSEGCECKGSAASCCCSEK